MLLCPNLFSKALEIGKSSFPSVDFVVSISGSIAAILAAITLLTLKDRLVMPDNKPKLNNPKLTCVIALIISIVLISHTSWGEYAERTLKYPVEEFQRRALERSEEIKLLDQAVKVAESKRWTSLAPGVGVGNNFASRNNDIRFNVNWDIAEVLGGGRIRQINLDIAQLKFRKLELESKLKMQVLENVLALERAERTEKRLEEKITMLKKRTELLEVDFKRGGREIDSMIKYWETQEDFENQRLKAQDDVILEKARLEQLVGVF